MRRYLLLLVCALFLCALPAHGQWYKRLGATLEHDLPSTLRGMTPAQAGISHALQEAVQRAEAASVATLHPAQKSIFRIKEKDWMTRFISINGTGFAIEEPYRGKKYVWGVTASHYAFTRPAVKLADRRKSIRVPFVIQGSAGRNDVTLFPLPENLLSSIVPLHLAAQGPQLEEQVSSVGYWNGKVHVDPVRTVQQIYPNRLITSLDIAPNAVREGTCGSPVLNAQGEVVGMHVGNWARQQIGYIVSVEHIRQALQAYHEGQFYQPIFFNGVEIGQLAINEYLDALEIYKEGSPAAKMSLGRRQKQVDYNHLETLIARESAVTRVVFFVERNPLSNQEEDQEYHMAEISYDLKTGQIARTEHPQDGWRY